MKKMRKEFYTEDEFWLIMYSKMKLPEFCEFIGINYPEFIKRDPEDIFTMDYDYVELKHLRKALHNGEREKAKQLFYQLEAQQPFFFPEDYEELEEILKRLGLLEEAKKYAKLAENEVNEDFFEKD